MSADQSVGYYGSGQGHRIGTNVGMWKGATATLLASVDAGVVGRQEDGKVILKKVKFKLVKGHKAD